MPFYCVGLGFFCVIDFVEFSSLVHSLLDEFAVAVDIDMEILVEFDDTFVGARFFLYGTFTDAKLVG